MIGSTEIILLLLVPVFTYVLGFFNGKSFWVKKALKKKQMEDL